MGVLAHHLLIFDTCPQSHLQTSNPTRQQALPRYFSQANIEKSQPGTTICLGINYIITSLVGPQNKSI